MLLVSAFITSFVFSSSLIFSSFIVTFGFMWILCKGLFSEARTFILSMLVLPVFVILSGSGFGVLNAVHSSLKFIPLMLGLGILTSIFALIFMVRFERVRIEKYYIGEVIGFGFIGLFAHSLFNATQPFSYNYQGNGEFLNYAKLAQYYLGSNDFGYGTVFFERHQTLRFGQDLWLGFVADFLKRQPIEVVHIVTGYCRFVHGVALALTLRALGMGFGARLFLAFSYLLSMVEIFSFNASFLSSNIYFPFAMLVGLMILSFDPLKKSKQNLSKIILLFAIFNIFGMLTYPEFHLLFLIFLMGVLVWVFLLRSASFKSVAITLGLIFCSLILGLIISPSIFISFLEVARSQAATGAGWNILGDPIQNVFEYLSFHFGFKLRLGETSYEVSPATSYFGVFVTLVLFFRGLFQVIRKKNKLAIVVGLWVLACLSANAVGVWQRTNFYAGTKLILQSHFIFMIVIGFGFFGLRQDIASRIKSKKMLIALRIFFLIPLGLIWFAQYIGGVRSSLSTARVYHFTHWKDFFEKRNLMYRNVLVLGDNDGEAVWFLDLLSTKLGLKVAPFNGTQLNRINREDPRPSYCSFNSRHIERDYRDSGTLILVPNSKSDDKFLYLADGSGASAPRGALGLELGLIDNFSVRSKARSSSFKFQWPEGSHFQDNKWDLCISIPVQTVRIFMSHIESEAEKIIYVVSVSGQEVKRIKKMAGESQVIDVKIPQGSKVHDIRISMVPESSPKMADGRVFINAVTLE